QAIKIKPPIGDILVIDKAPYAFESGRLRDGRKRTCHLMLNERRRCSGLSLFFGKLRRPKFCTSGVVTGAEAFKIAVDRLAILSNGRLELFACERQPAAAGDSAEHHRIDERAALLCQGVHVDEESVFRMLVDDLDEPVLIEASVTHRNLF